MKSVIDDVNLPTGTYDYIRIAGTGSYAGIESLESLSYNGILTAGNNRYDNITRSAAVTGPLKDRACSKRSEYKTPYKQEKPSSFLKGSL